MIGLLRGEYRKLTTTQVWFWLLLGGLALTALGVVAVILTDGSGGTGTEMNTPDGQRQLVALAAEVRVFALILGIIGITAEYRHLTVTPSYLATPRRGRVVAAKLVTYAGVGLAFSVAAILLVLAIGVPWLAAKDITLSLTSNDIPLVVLAALVVTAIYGVLGVGLGALIHNQVGAVVGALVWMWVAEPLMGVIPGVKAIYRFLPGAAANAVAQVDSSTSNLLTPWQAGLVLIGYGLLFAWLATRLTIRRDVT